MEVVDDCEVTTNVIDTDNAIQKKGIKRKRKRKRKRNRSQKKKKIDEIEQIVEKVIEEIKPLNMNVQVKPKLHIKFGDNDEIVYCSNDYIYNYDEDISYTLITKRIQGILNNLTEIEIFSAKSGKKIKSDDCIIFKILRMGINYAPEVSSVIVAKVLLFDEVALDLQLEIIEGQDQIYEPKGKFSLEADTTDNDNLVTTIESTTNEPYTTNLMDLIEPRIVSDFFQN